MSDNYFDLLPGEPVSIRLNTSANIDNLKAGLKTMSLTEAFHVLGRQIAFTQ